MLGANKDEMELFGTPEGELEDEETEIKMVYGKNTDFMYGKFPDGSRSSPHFHICEQINFVQEGKIWMFVEDEAFLLGPGDFHRIPPKKVHWSRVEEGPVVITEAHSPPMIGDDWSTAVGLFGDDEDPTPEESARNIWASEDYAENEEEMMQEKLEESA